MFNIFKKKKSQPVKDSKVKTVDIPKAEIKRTEVKRAEIERVEPKEFSCDIKFRNIETGEITYIKAGDFEAFDKMMSQKNMQLIFGD